MIVQDEGEMRQPVANLYLGDCIQIMQEMPEESVDLVFTSPPYALKTQRYGECRYMTWQEWVAWMTGVVTECCRVSRGFVLVNANNPVKGGEELPCNEFLRTRLYEKGISSERTVIWNKNSPPNKRPWWVNTWEPVMAFYEGERPKTWNWESIAVPPKYKAGGKFRQRDSNGKRRMGGEYPQNALARPRDVLRVNVGGGQMGSRLAHGNEAPFPVKLVEPFVLSLTNPGDVVMDPFCGSGTTAQASLAHGRDFIGIDNRQSQVDLSQRRIEECMQDV